MYFKILGSAAGGGFPQWNCNCENCRGVRSGRIKAERRTQSSAAFSADGRSWVLINASPDFLYQVEHFLPHPEDSPARFMKICAVILTDAQMDHAAGLPMLREGCPMPLYCTDEVYGELTENLTVLKVLKHWDGGFERRPIKLGAGFRIPEANATAEFSPIELTSNAPPYSPFRDRPRPGDSIGVGIVNLETGRRLVYAPDLMVIEESIKNTFDSSDVVFTDGTFSRDDEMIRNGTGGKKALDMGHAPIFGPGGTLNFFRELKTPRVILTHINNTNPILNENSPEFRSLSEHGIETARDGLTVEF